MIKEFIEKNKTKEWRFEPKDKASLKNINERYSEIEGGLSAHGAWPGAINTEEGFITVHPYDKLMDEKDLKKELLDFFKEMGGEMKFVSEKIETDKEAIKRMSIQFVIDVLATFVMLLIVGAVAGLLLGFIDRLIPVFEKSVAMVWAAQGAFLIWLSRGEFNPLAIAARILSFLFVILIALSA